MFRRERFQRPKKILICMLANNPAAKEMMNMAGNSLTVQRAGGGVSRNSRVPNATRSASTAAPRKSEAAVAAAFI